MLSSLSGTIINRSQIGRSLNISEKSIRDYLDISQGSYIWRNIPCYLKASQKSLIKMPRGNFQDSGIKFGTKIKYNQLQTLKKFVKENKLPLGIVINNGDQIQLVADNIIQLPATFI